MSRKGKPTFRTWLWMFLEDDSPMGDLAKDAKADSEWRGQSVYSLEDRLNELEASQAAKDTLTQAKTMFLRDV